MVDLKEIKDLVLDQGEAWESFQAKNKAHLSKLDEDIDTLVKKANRPGAPDRMVEKSEHFELFEPYLRHGDNEKSLRDHQIKAMSVGDDPSGGYLVPAEIDEDINSLIRDLSPIRQVAKVVEVSTTSIEFLVSKSDASTGWVHETTSRPVTDSGTFASIHPAFGELYTAPQITQQLADDSFINIGNWLAMDIADNFAQTEGAAFITGDGVNKPRGILSYDTAATSDATRDFGTIEYIASGAAGAFATSAAESQLIDVVHATKPGHRQNAVWLMNSATLGGVRKLTDSNGDALWKQSLAVGTPSTLLGYPLLEDENMPDIAANSFSIAFGDFKRGYVICDRVGITLLRDPFTSRGNIIFYTRKRLGGSLLNSQAIKLMKFAAS